MFQRIEFFCVLAVVWQLMRAYTLTVLSKCTDTGDKLATDTEIREWVNQKVNFVCLACVCEKVSFLKLVLLCITFS